MLPVHRCIWPAKSQASTCLPADVIGLWFHLYLILDLYNRRMFIRTILTRAAASIFLAAPSITGVGSCPECGPSSWIKHQVAKALCGAPLLASIASPSGERDAIKTDNQRNGFDDPAQ